MRPRPSRRRGESDVEVGGVLVFGLVVTAVGVLQCYGLLVQSNHVDALGERAYLGCRPAWGLGFGVRFLPP